MTEQKNFSAKVTGVISNNLEIRGAPDWFVDESYEAFTFTNPQYEQVLKYSPYARPGAKIPQFLHFADYDKERGLLWLPRGSGPNFYKTDRAKDLFDTIEWADARHESPASFPNRQLSLNSDQSLLVENWKKFLPKEKSRFGTGYYLAPTSAGKTILQATMAEMTGQKTGIIWTTTLIKEAWYNDLQKLYGLSRKDIGIFQQNSLKFGEQFTLLSLATLGRRRDYWEELGREFGTLIVDEVQNVTMPTLYEFLRSFKGKFIIGATATDKGAEKSAFYLRTTMGWPLKKIFSTSRDTSSSLALQDAVPIPTKFYTEIPSGTLDFADLCSRLAADDERNKLVVEKVKEQYDKGHGCLLVTRKVEHAYVLQAMLQEAGIEDANLIIGETNADKFYVQSLVSMVLTGKIRCIVSTVQAVKLGANLNTLSCLFLVMPIGNTHDLEQLIGRIRRRAMGKNHCVLHYFLDDRVSYLRGKWHKVCVPTFQRLKVKRYLNNFAF